MLVIEYTESARFRRLERGKSIVATVICAGMITVDFVYDLPAFPPEGSKNRASASRMVAGGGALIAAAAVARLGGHAMLAGAIGADALGDFLRTELRRLSIDDRLVESVGGVETSRSAIIVTERGERTIVNHRDARLFGHSPDQRAVSDCDVVLTDTRWERGATALLGAAACAGKPAIVDAEAPLSAVGDALDLATHIVFSEQGLADFSATPAAEAIRAAATRFKAWTAVTRGARPVIHLDETTVREAPALAVDAVDTLGAGDVWHGAFALQLASGRSEREAVAYANAAAAVMVSRGGPDRYPAPGEVEAMIAKGAA